MRKNRLFLTLVAIGLFVNPSHGLSAIPQDPDWKFTGWSGGGAFPYVYTDPTQNGVVWIVSDVAGILKSTDRGENWNWSTKNLKNVAGSTIVQAPSNPSIFYHASGRTEWAGSVNKSTDGGATWSNQGMGTKYRLDINSHKALVVDRLNPNVAYLGNVAGELYRTVDGTTWNLWKTAAELGLGPIQAMVVDLNNNYLYVGSASGLRRISVTDGSVVTLTLTGTNATRNRDMIAIRIDNIPYVFVAAGDRIAYTSNDGLNWLYTSTIGISSTNSINRLAVAPGSALATTKIMAAYTTNSFSFSGGMVKSSTGGQSWAAAGSAFQSDKTQNPTRMWHPKNANELVLSLTVDPFNANVWYSTDFWGIYRTDDFGGLWTEKIKGAGNTVISDVRMTPNGEILVASMDNGLLKSTDGGVTWKMLIPNNVAGQNYPDVAGHIWKVIATGTLDDWNAGRGHIIATDWAWDSPVKHKILRSTDNGNSWQVITNAGIPNDRLFSGVWGDGYLRSIDYTAGKILVGLDGYVGNVNGGIFESSDDGLTWVRKTPNPQPTTNYGADWRIFNALARNPMDPQNIIYGTFNAVGIKYSLNGGQTWNYPSVGNQYFVYEIKFGSDGTAYAAGVYGSYPTLYRSKDKGATWQEIWRGPSGFASADALEVDPTDFNRLVLSTTTNSSENANQLFMTEDATAANPTFTNITGNLPDGAGMASCAFQVNQGVSSALFCGRIAGGVFKMDMSGNTPPPPPAPDTTAPTVPANLVATVNANVISLNWTASTDNVAVTAYQVFDANVLLNTTTTNSYSFTGIEGRGYYFTVKALDAANNVSAASAIATAVINPPPPPPPPTPDTTAPSAPSALTATLNGSLISLLWNASTDNVGVTGYQIFNANNLLGTATTAAYSMTSTAGQTYDFMVKAFDAANNFSVSSNVATLTVGTPPPPPTDTAVPTTPTGLSFTISGTQAILTWGASTDDVGVTQYRIMDEGVLSGTSTTTTFAKTLLEGTTHAFSVIAEDASGKQSTASSIALVTVPLPGGPTAPTNLVAYHSGSQVQMSWQPSTNHFGYNIWRNGVYLKTLPATATSSFDNQALAGNSYTYTVQAYNASDKRSPMSNAVTVTIPGASTTDTTAPTVPTGLSLVLGTNNAINAQWSASTDNVGVSLYWVYSNGTQLGSTSSTSFTMPNAVSAQTYQFTVKACDSAANCSALSTPSSISLPDTISPSAPASLTAVLSGSQALLSWQAATDNVGVTGYQVFNDQILVGNTTATTYTYQPIVMNQIYHFSVKAIDAANNISVFSNEVTVPIDDTTPPTAPTQLAAAVTGSQAVLTWTASTDNVAVTQYQIFKNGALLATSLTNSYTVTGLLSGQTDTFTVKALDAKNNISAASNPVTTGVAGPNAPKDLIAYRYGNYITVSWSSVPNAAGYALYRNDVFLKNVTGLTTNDKTVSGSTAYAYKVQAYDASNNYSKFSNVMSVTMPAGPTTPTNLIGSRTSSTKVMLNWTASTNGVLGYNVYRNGNYYRTINMTTSFSDTVTAGVNYTYKIQAYNASDIRSPFSNEVTI